MEERELSFYLDTTIPNYLFADDTPRERDITKQFWKEIKKDKYNVFISRLVVDEIERTSDLDRRKRFISYNL